MRTNNTDIKSLYLGSSAWRAPRLKGGGEIGGNFKFLSLKRNFKNVVLDFYKIR